MQSSQSSATIALRAIIMLAFIIAIPMAAFNGSVLPEKAKKLLDQFWPTITSAISKNSTNANVLSEAPSFNSKPQPLLAIPGQNANSTADPAVQLAANNQPNQPNLIPMQAAGGNAERLTQQTSAVMPADYQNPIEPANKAPVYNNSGQTDANPFMAMQNRLKQLGATYYLLETWGNQRQYYRFYCQMSIGGNSSYTHYFEATNPNPMAAMADVLQQVEAWRGGAQ